MKSCKAFVDGSHFVYASGDHGDFYVNKDALYMHPKKLDDVCYMLYEQTREAYGVDIDVVLSPTYGSILIGQLLAYNYCLNGKDVKFAYAEGEPTDNYRIIRGGFRNILSGAKVLLVADIVTTGNTLVSLAQAAIRADANVVGASVLCDRGKVRTLKFCPMDKQGIMSSTPFELNIVTLLEMDLKTFPADQCPLCESGRPIDPEFGVGHLMDPFRFENKP